MKPKVKKIRKGTGLERLSEEQRVQIWRQIEYHVQAPLIEKLVLGPEEIVFEIGHGVTRPMSSKMLARWVWDHGEHVSGRTVLDMGTGCGIQGIVAAMAGAKRVDMVDVMPEAVQSARNNALLFGVADKCRVQTSDLFESVPIDTGYDVIIFDQPLFADEPIEEYRCTIGMLNPGKLINDFFDRASEYLNREGHAILLAWDFASKENNPINVGAERGWDIEIIDVVRSEGGIQQGQMEVVVLCPRRVVCHERAVASIGGAQLYEK